MIDTNVAELVGRLQETIRLLSKASATLDETSDARVAAGTAYSEALQARNEALDELLTALSSRQSR